RRQFLPAVRNSRLLTSSHKIQARLPLHNLQSSLIDDSDCLWQRGSRGISKTPLPNDISGVLGDESRNVSELLEVEGRILIGAQSSLVRFGVVRDRESVRS